ncbi:MAG: long-chain fatty acid--CoA ligase [Nitrospinae bacterium]|nr:long-chain fatty acid--CoA ligase [Nitrospinota bacterium]
MSGYDYSTLPRELNVPDMPVTGFVARAAEKFPDNPAIHYFGTQLTYRQFDQSIRKLMNVLRSLGVGRGDVVALMTANCPQALMAYQAVLRLGAILTQVNPLYVEREVERQLNDSGAKAALALDLVAERVINVMDRTQVKSVLVFSLRDYMAWPVSWLFPVKLLMQKRLPRVPQHEGVVWWNSVFPAASAEIEAPPVSPGDLALYQYTGGTTGDAKGVELTHRNLVANTLQARRWFVDAQEGKEVILLALPMFHAFGMTVGMNLAWALAGKLALIPKFDAAQVMGLIERQRVTMFPGVPAMYVSIINHPAALKRDISSVRYCISGAASLAPETRAAFERLTGGKLVEGYGLTEASPVTHCNPLPGGAKNGSIGMDLPGTQSRIVNEEGAELPVGEVGELILRGPQVMRGYKGSPEETARVIRNGWLFTGDMAYRDDDGFVFLMDRKKDMIITGGCNVYPREIEDLLMEIEGVAEAGVVGARDERFGEMVVAASKSCAGTWPRTSSPSAWCSSKNCPAPSSARC